MKFVVLLVVVVAVLWLARSARRQARPTDAGDAAPPAQEAMVVCGQCGVHLPRSEALPGRGGLFCSEAHRSDFERADRAG
jgi:uncharacterized protein